MNQKYQKKTDAFRSDVGKAKATHDEIPRKFPHVSSIQGGETESEISCIEKKKTFFACKWKTSI